MSRINKAAKISIPKDISYPKWKVEIEAQSDDATHDLTGYLSSGTFNLRSTNSLDNFSLEVDSVAGKWKGKFQAGDYLNLYYDYTEGSLSTIKFRGRLDGAYDNFNGAKGFFISIEGRNFPVFGDPTINISFDNINVLDSFLGRSGDVDSEGNYPNGFLYESGLTLKVYDTSSNAFVVYKNLSAEQKTTLKSLSAYNNVVLDKFESRARVSIASSISNDNDLAWRIKYTSSVWYIEVLPSTGVKNTGEVAVLGQNILNVTRFGIDTKQEFNRVKTIGESDGEIALFRTKEDTARQSALWIKDYSEQISELNTDELVEAKAIASLNRLKQQVRTGKISVPALATLQPAEIMHHSMPYIYTGDLLVPSIVISLGLNGLEFENVIREREDILGDIFKDIINVQSDQISLNNPNNMLDGFVFDFSGDTSGLTFLNCGIIEEVLTISPGQSSGTLTTSSVETDSDITNFELKIDAITFQNCTYRVSNNGGKTFENYSLGTLHTFNSTGNLLILEITLNQINTENPQFKKINLRTKY